MALIAHWPLNGNVNDISGNDYNGSIYGTLNTDTAGKIGSTYVFTNTNNGVNIPNVNFSGLYTYTISAWINPAGNHLHYNGAIISSGNWNGTCWSFGVNQTNTSIDAAGPGYNKYISYTVPLNTWTHILSVVSDNISKVYVNGSYIGQIAVGSSLVSDATNTFIGRETYADGYFAFNGKINDVRIYNHALSEKEIYLLAQAKVLHYTFNDFQEPTTNLMPNSPINSYPMVGNGHGTQDTTQYNNNISWSIGTVISVIDNIVTVDGTGRAIHTYDCINADTTGGGVTAGTQYFVKKHSANQFSLHVYNGSQDGSQGYINPTSGGHQVHYDVDMDIRVSINATSFPTMWHSNPHQPNQGIVKEIITNGFSHDNRVHDCIRIHKKFRGTDPTNAYMAYGVYPPVTAGEYYAFSFYVRAINKEAIGHNIQLTLHTGAGWSSGTYGNYAYGLPLKYEWQRYEMVALAPNSGGTNMYWPGVGTMGDIEISEIMCEHKKYSTPYIENTRTGIISDISGFENNADIIESYTPRWTKDTGIGSGAYYFDGLGDYLQLGNPGSFAGFDNCTISFWRKNDATITYWLPFVGQTTSHYIMATSSGTGNFYHTNAGTPKIYKDGVYAGTTAVAPFTDTTAWHHYVLTNVNLSVWTTLKLGSYPDPWHIEGYFSDIRLYNSELSDDDILSLYQQKASLDEKGNLFLNEIDINGIGDSTNKIPYYQMIEDSDIVGQSWYDLYGTDSYINNRIAYSSAPEYSAVSEFGLNPVGELDLMTKVSINTTHYAQYRQFGVTYYFVADVTKKYRVSQWVYCHAEPSTSYSQNNHYGILGSTVCNLNTTTVNTNPYFTAPTMSGSHMDRWVLWVYYIFPYGSTGNPSNVQGYYYTDGTFTNTGSNFNWASGITNTYLRQYTMYQYGEIAAGSYVKRYRPRIDIVDGTEPELSVLLQCNEHRLLDNNILRRGINKDSTGNFTSFSNVGIADDSLVGYWPLKDNNTLDFSGNASDGTIYGGVTPRSSHYSFDGEDLAYIDMGNPTALSALGGTSNITIMLMARYTAYDGGSETYSVLTYKGTPWTWLIENPSNKIRFRATIGGTDTNVADPDVHPLNQWIHIAATYDGVNMKLYINGVEKATGARTGTLGTTTQPMRLGTYATNQYMFHGDMKNVKIFNRALTAEEIAIENGILNSDEKMKLHENGTLYIAGDIIEGL